MRPAVQIAFFAKDLLGYAGVRGPKIRNSASLPFAAREACIAGIPSFRPGFFLARPRGTPVQVFDKFQDRIAGRRADECAALCAVRHYNFGVPLRGSPDECSSLGHRLLSQGWENDITTSGQTVKIDTVFGSELETIHCALRKVLHEGHCGTYSAISEHVAND
jgi:hypothetical protein